MLFAWSVCFGGLGPVDGQELPIPDLQEDTNEGLPNMKSPTLGGKQFWTDHVWRRGWKIQQHAVTGHWRLIDDRSFRFAWGTRAACESELEKRVPEASLPQQRVFVLLHGLMRSSASMNPVAEALRGAFECSTVNFEYASTRASITDHAAAFRDFVASLPSDTRLSFVGHSMGSIVARHAIGDWQRNNDVATLARIERFVMLAPPNQGASMARQLSRVGLFRWITGTSGMELGPEWQAFEAKLATPHCPFGIIAGKLSEKSPRNPLLEGEGDFVVSVEETKLAGAADFLVVPRMHTFLMDDSIVQAAIVHFMRDGKFQ